MTLQNLLFWALMRVLLSTAVYDPLLGGAGECFSWSPIADLQNQTNSPGVQAGLKTDGCL